MAGALCLRRSKPLADCRPVSAIGIGSFGEGVVEALAGEGLRSTSKIKSASEPRLLDDLLGRCAGDDLLICLAGEHPGMLEGVDDRSFAEGFRWLPVQLTAERVLVGPIVAPSESPCYGCFAVRQRGASPNPLLDEEIDTAASLGVGRAPSGFLALHPMMGAALARALADAYRSGHWSAHTVIGMGLFDRVVRIGASVGVGGCPRCGPPPADARPSALIQAVNAAMTASTEGAERCGSDR